MPSISPEHTEQSPEHSENPMKTVGIILDCIDLYWDFLFELQNTLTIGGLFINDSGEQLSDPVTIQRYYENAYYLRFEIIKRAENIRQKKVLAYGEVLETIELIMYPTNIMLGMVNIKHISPEGVINSAEVPINQLPKLDKTVNELIKRLELRILSLLISKCIGRDIFDPFPNQVKAILTNAYGKQAADELWRSEFSKKIK